MQNSTVFSEVLFMDYGEGHFSDVPIYYRVRLSPTMKIEYGYFHYNWNENFSEMKKLHNRSYGVEVGFFRKGHFSDSPYKESFLRENVPTLN